MKSVYLVLIALCFIACSQTQNTKTSEPDKAKSESKSKKGVLVLIESEEGLQGYVDEKGDTVIAMGKYSYCFTDSFRNFAIVASDKGLIGINRDETQLFNVYMYDNGPDYIADGLFRIIKDKKIGYANTNGEVILEPQYTCAYPFKDGKAKVAMNCSTHKDGEHAFWESEEWFFIDKKGNRVD